MASSTVSKAAAARQRLCDLADKSKDPAVAAVFRELVRASDKSGLLLSLAARTA